MRQSVLQLLVGISLLLTGGHALGQSGPVLDSGVTYVGLGLGGFMPMREAYRINYSTDVLALPIELFGEVQFPVTLRTHPKLGVRYIRRTANFVQSTTISVIQIEPGVRYWFDPAHVGRTDRGDPTHEIGMFGSASAQIARATVSGEIDESQNGRDVIRREVSKDYYNFGVGLGLGLSYPLTSRSFVDAGVHVSIYVADPVSTGGLGNIGGVSFDVAYRFGF